MVAKPKASKRRAAAPSVAGKLKSAGTTSPPLNLEERLHRIEAMGKRIDEFIRFICQIAGQTGTSAEVKERAVAAFYEQMVLVERQLGHIHDELRLE
jgi:hypothetical protein